MTTRHSLSEVDPDSRSATCSECGPVRVHSNGRGGWTCSVRNLATAKGWKSRNPEKARQGEARWRAANADRVTRANREWRAKNPERVEAIEFRRGLRLYGLTSDEYDALLKAQGGACATCDRTEPGGNGRWHIDHDHTCCPTGGSCGKCVRGLLCSSCNRALGLVRDDVAVLLRMADYVTTRRTLKT